MLICLENTPGNPTWAIFNTGDEEFMIFWSFLFDRELSLRDNLKPDEGEQVSHRRTGFLPSACYDGAWAGGASKTKQLTVKKRASDKYLHDRKQALVYLWLEKPNIAKVMHSQSAQVPYCIPRVQ